VLDFSEGVLEECYEKVGDVALFLGLFPSKRWKVLFFRASDGNRMRLGFPSLARKRMSTNLPKLPISPSEKSIALSENVPKSIGTSEKVFDGFLGEIGLFW
jgi:hypothetical protein